MSILTQLKKNENGFSLLELIVSVSIIAVLAALAFPATQTMDT